MSKSKSPRSPVRDWPAILQAARAADTPITDEKLELWRRGLIHGDDLSWGPDYVNALQQAIEGRNAHELLAMLDAEVPLPRPLLPLLADLLRAQMQGTLTGKPTRLIAQDDANIRFLFDIETGEWGRRIGVVQEHLAVQYGVSVDTIKRSLARTKQKR